MTRPLIRSGVVLVLAATALLATACTSGPNPAASTVPSSNASSPVASPEPSQSETPEEPATAPTCETIIPESAIAGYADVGWESQAEPFVLAGVELEGGIQCKWGDLTTATDHIQMFGWAPIAADAATSAEEQLSADGWTTEQSDAGVIVTESPETAIYTDDEGYGWTYLFGDGWVKFADTKQSLLLVEWPRA